MKDMLRKFGLFSIIIGVLVSSTGVGLGLGYWAWKTLNTSIWLPILTTFVGLGLGFYKIYEISQREL